ncbi:MAG: hypothetical protein WCP79_13455 [Bacillota bacterium]
MTSAICFNKIDVADELEKVEPLLTNLDSAAGDGDLGISMCRGAAAIRALPDSAWTSEVSMLNSIGEALEKAVVAAEDSAKKTAQNWSGLVTWEKGL